MIARQLGRSGLQVSPLAVGTMNFGPVTSESDSHHILDRAADAGITVIDTADVYGAHPTNQAYGNEPDKGLTEQIIGRWFAAGGGRRDSTVLMTKVFGRMGPGPDDLGLSARHILRACDESLRRLQTDRIDVYFLHHVDRNTPWDEVWSALGTLHDAGKIVYAATSNHAAWQIVAGQEEAARRGRFGFVADQSIYNLKERTVELEVLPACRAYGVGIVPYSSLHGGLLAGALAKSDALRSSAGRAEKAIAADRPQIERYEALCADLAQHPATVALAWLLHQEGVATVPLGLRTVDQLAASAAAVDLRLDDATLARLDDIFPGPGGPAPEAYAW